MSHAAQSEISTELSQVVIRCGCSAEQKAAPDWHASHGQVCPRPRALEDRGVVAARYANPIVQRAWEAMRRAAGFVPGTVTSSPKE